MGSRKSKPSGNSKGTAIFALILAIAGLSLAGFQFLSDNFGAPKVYVAQWPYQVSVNGKISNLNITYSVAQGDLILLEYTAYLHLGMSSANGGVTIFFVIDGVTLTDIQFYIYDDENDDESVILRYFMTASQSATHDLTILATREDAANSYLQYNVLKVQII